MSTYLKRSCYALLLSVGLFHADAYASCEPVCDYNPYLCCSEDCTVRDCGIFFGGQLLWWAVYQTNLDYAVDSKRRLEDPELFPLIVGPGDTHFIDYSWDGGWRVFAGVRGCDCWDIRGIYTRFIKTGRGSTEARCDNNLLTTLTHPGTNPNRAQKAEGRLDLDYQVADMSFSRPFKASRTTILRPYFGFRALFLDQKMKVKYEGREFEKLEENGEGLGGPGRVEWKSYYYGVGGNCGMETNIDLLYGFKFLGDCSCSLVAGRTKQSHKQWMEGICKVRVDVDEKQTMILPGMHVASGFSWEACLFQSSWIVFRAMYEMNLWLHTPQLRRYDGDNDGVSNSATAGTIGLHGGTFELRILF